MAKLPLEQTVIISELKQQLLNLINEAKLTEFNLLASFGENDSTIIALEQLTEIAEQARNRFSQFSTLEIRIAESQPDLTPDMIEFIQEKIILVQNRIPALERSIQEIKTDWNLL